MKKSELLEVIDRYAGREFTSINLADEIGESYGKVQRHLIELSKKKHVHPVGKTNRNFPSRWCQQKQPIPTTSEFPTDVPQIKFGFGWK
jgi:hypothetical protein